ncbi:hypothetical protein [Neisseria elongata]|jgi:hypothetical protein|uniref:hypothetical protein n=1 Tax=Neisseria elongata TaxID=495 RepID=UPI000D317A91|nr:hypothetical protein [Neisseria elongata]
MAIWNFRYYLIPSTAIKDTFATDKDILLNEYRSNNFPNYNAYREFKNYFINNEVLSSITNEAKKNLIPKEFWDKNATMFSDNNGNSITIWTDDIECELDLRFNYAGFVQQTIDWAIKYNCLLVIEKTGNVIFPDINNLAFEINNLIQRINNLGASLDNR